jgi:hypothetical protein
LLSELIVEDRKISVLIYESTLLGKKSALIVHTKTFLDVKEEVRLIDLTALEIRKAETMKVRIFSFLLSYSLLQSDLLRKLICFECGGASWWAERLVLENCFTIECNNLIPLLLE